MDILSPLEKPLAREKLTHLVTDPPGASAVELSGKIATHQVLIRVRRGGFSLPWCGTFRGALVPIGEGTLITGKFDSNWALYFFGYPILLGVTINIVVTLLSGYGFAQLGWFALFVFVAALLCGCLHWRDLRHRRLIVASVCRSTLGQVNRAPE